MGPRVPLALQAVFLASNRGETVNVPPPEANKVFVRKYPRHGVATTAGGGDSEEANPRIIKVRGGEANKKNKPQQQRRRRSLWGRLRSPRRGGADSNSSSNNNSKSISNQQKILDTTRSTNNNEEEVVFDCDRHQQHNLSFDPTDHTETMSEAEDTTHHEEEDSYEVRVMQNHDVDAVDAENRTIPRNIVDTTPTPRHHSPPSSQPQTVSSRDFYGRPSPGKATVFDKQQHQTTPKALFRQDAARSTITDNDSLSTYEDSSSEDESSENKNNVICAQLSGIAKNVPSLQGGPKEAESLVVSPQVVLDAMLRERGYSTARFPGLSTAYYNRPTPLQQASYQNYFLQCIRTRQTAAVEAMLKAGLSPNPLQCSSGESVLHLVCRAGNWQMLQLLLAHGASVQTVNDFGRSPLHDAVWTTYPSFATVELLLDQDVRLLHVTDWRGALPLAYVPRHQWVAWGHFLEQHADRYWPRRDIDSQGAQPFPSRVLQPPHSHPQADPKRPLPFRVAVLVAQGRLEPEESLLLLDEEEVDRDDEDDCSEAKVNENVEENDDEDDDDEDDDDDSFVSAFTTIEERLVHSETKDLQPIGQRKMNLYENEIRVAMQYLANHRSGSRPIVNRDS